MQNELNEAIGYAELGLHADALDLVNALPSRERNRQEVMWFRLELLVDLKQWEEGAQAGQELCEKWPLNEDAFFKTAYCLHELKRTSEAKSTLLAAPEAARQTALFYYNLACYETQLGNIDEAQRLLIKCFEKDRTYRPQSLEDPDLKALWAWI